MSTNLIPLGDIERMAAAIAKSRLFGIQTPEQGVALMLVSQAEGRHPAIAARDYHIIQGRPTLKADTMLARFQEAGGKVEWHALTNEVAEATFSHPAGGSVRLSWMMKDADRAGLSGKDNWKKYPRAQLRSRLVSEGVRTVFPGVICGTYTAEEVESFTPGATGGMVEVDMGVAERVPDTTIAALDERIEAGILELGLDRERVLRWIERAFRGQPVPDESVDRVMLMMAKWANDMAEERAEREAIQSVESEVEV